MTDLAAAFGRATGSRSLPSGTKEAKGAQGPDCYQLAMEILNLPAAERSESLIETFLIRDGAFVGRKYRFEGGYAIWPLGGLSIEFYRDDGSVLEIVAVKDRRRIAAA
jgi:hypothetical protein